MTDLTLTGLVKRYGRVTALDGLSFDVQAGEFFCLLGPSAAGKTTTLRAISGLERLEAGPGRVRRARHHRRPRCRAGGSR